MARKRSSVESKTKQFTIRIPQALAGDFETQVKGDGIDNSTAAMNAIREWLRQRNAAQEGVGAEDLQESLQENLIAAVTEHLRSNTAWAESALIDASFRDPVVSVYMQRVHHFHSEKKALSDHFGRWLVDRMFHYVKQGVQVRLVVESGTTLKALLDGFGPFLQTKLAGESLHPDDIQIITSNFPGAESYEAHASSVEIGDRRLSDIVPCVLVPGRALREYSAVVGAQAEKYLRDFCTRAPQAKKKLVRIGLVVGNWVMLDGLDSRPTPLARGDGHKSFKEQVFANCDESFLISPLCKIVQGEEKSRDLAQNLEEFNRDLLGASRDGKKDYAAVDWSEDGARNRRVKMVTTSRQKSGSIVHTHSMMISRSIGARPQADYSKEVEMGIEPMNHFIYEHDANSERSFDEQLKAELPHKKTQEPGFRRKWFHVTRDEQSAAERSRR